MAIRTRQRKSAVLILAILLMGAIVGSAISLSTVIADTSHQTQTLNDFISASIAADSGLERGLAVVKAGRQSTSQPQTLAITTGGITPTTAITLPTAGATNPVTLQIDGTVPNTDTLTWKQISPGNSVTFDIVNYFSGAITSLVTNQNKINIVGTAKTVSALRLGVLDVSWIGLDTNGQPFYSGRTFLGPTLMDGATSTSIDLWDPTLVRDLSGNLLSAGTPLTQTLGFRVRLSVVDHQPSGSLSPAQNTTLNSIFNISVTDQATTNPAGNFPSRIYIKSTGKLNASQSQKTASVLWQLPASGVFNYVLFTEGDIIPK